MINILGRKKLNQSYNNINDNNGNKGGYGEYTYTNILDILAVTKLPLDLTNIISSYIPIFIYQFMVERLTNKNIEIKHTISLFKMNINDGSNYKNHKMKIYHFDSISNSSNQPRRNCIVIKLNEFIYLLGGVRTDNFDISRQVECYNIFSNEWSINIEPMMEYRFSPAAVAHEEKIYVFGGAYNDSTCEVFHPGSDPRIEGKWYKISNMKKPRFGACATALNNKLYVFGGSQGPGKKLRDCECYDLNQNKWQDISTIPQRTMNSTALVLNQNCIALLGGLRGRNSLQHSEKVLLYNISQNEWKYALWKLPQKLYDLFACMLPEGNIFVSGATDYFEHYIANKNNNQVYGKLQKVYSNDYQETDKANTNLLYKWTEMIVSTPEVQTVLSTTFV